MPNLKFEKPHAITCIKRDIKNCLRAYSGNELTIVCDRDYCWDDEELFKFRQAINISVVNDSVRGPVKAPRQNKTSLGELRTVKDSVCNYDASVSIEIQIYVEDCDCNDYDTAQESNIEDCDCITGIDKAYAILAHVSQVLHCKKDQIAGRRILYRGSATSTTSEGDLDIAILVANFDVEYLLDPTNHNLVG